MSSVRSRSMKVDPSNLSPLLDLPTEILLLIIEYFDYPDALGLKCVHPRLRDLVQPKLTVSSRVEWLIGRADQGLSVPRWIQLNLKTDQGFTSNPEVRMMLRKRRKHEDCRDLAFRHLHNQPVIQPLLNSIVSHRWYSLDLRCNINPNKLQCRGTRQACNMVMRLWGPADFPVEHISSAYSRHKRMTLGVLRTLVTVLWGLLCTVAFAIVYVNKIRLRVMFRIWTLIEALVIVAVIAHFLFGIDYSTMGGNLDLVNHRKALQSFNVGLWSFIEPFTTWLAPT